MGRHHTRRGAGDTDTQLAEMTSDLRLDTSTLAEAPSVLPVSTNGHAATAGSESPVTPFQAPNSSLPDQGACTPKAKGEAAGSHSRSPSWEEKGKSIYGSEESQRTPPSARLPKLRSKLPSAGSSVASSPRSSGASGFAFSPPERLPPPGSTSGGQYPSPPDLKTLTGALASKSPDAQMRALKKLKLDVELCRCLAEDERGAALLVGLAEPARSWLPSFGCTDLQTTAAAALGSMARVPSARPKIAAAGGLPALVNILNTGSFEAQSNAARALGRLAEDTSLAFQVGQAGACAPLVRMLTSATAFHSAIASFQMTTDHEEAQANAAAALASLASTTANTDKIVKAGGIAPLVLLLSAESPALQAAAARCLRSLCRDHAVAERIAESGAVDVLLGLLDSKDVGAAAAAAAALGVATESPRVAARAIPRLAELTASDSAEVRTAAAGSLASLAHSSTINKVKIAGESDLIASLVRQLHGADAQLRLGARLEGLRGRAGEAPLPTLLEGVLGKPMLRSVAKLAQQVHVPLNNSTDVPELALALRTAAMNEQLAVARLFSCLSADSFSQSRLIETGAGCLTALSRLLGSDSGTVRAKAAAALANLAGVSAEAVRRTGCEAALIRAAGAASEARVPALRCVLNLTHDEDCLDALVAAGAIGVLLAALRLAAPEAQRLAAGGLANIAVSPKLRELVVSGGGIPLLVALLASPDEKLQAPAAAALWQLCGDGSTADSVCATPGAAAAAVAALHARSPAVQENAAGLVACLSQSSRNAEVGSLLPHAEEDLALEYPSARTATDLLAAMRLVPMLPETLQAQLSEEGAVEPLLPLLRSRSADIQASAADALRCAAAVSDENRLAIAADAVPTLGLLLGSPLHDAQLGAAGCLAALAATDEVKEQIGQAGVIPHLVQLMRTGQPQAKVAAGTALTSLSINSPANLRDFVRAGGVPLLKQLLGAGPPGARDAAAGALGSLAVSLPSSVAGGGGGGSRDGDGNGDGLSPSTSHEHADDPGTPTMVLHKRKTWRSPSMVPDAPLPLPDASQPAE